MSEHARRDRLLGYEGSAQQLWQENKAFEATPETGKDKFMVTFPYPYSNGALHVGHAFSLSKAEFSAGYQRHKGKNVLFPFAFHCTGMPIAACAKRLAEEIEQFGNPPVFPQQEEKPAEPSSAQPQTGKKKKKGKLAGKKSAKKYQWQIMQEMKVPEDIIAEFANAKRWLDYWPGIGQCDLKRFGLSADWRRSFITTDINPYYDSFIRWQFNTLHKRGYIKFGNRPCVFSTKEMQACADHDRASGEGIGPQEYTIIKIQVLPGETPFTQKNDDKLAPFLKDKKVFLVAGTLRPETMVGQTNVWAFPNGDYEVVQVNDDEVWVTGRSAARNMTYQGLFQAERGEIPTLASIKGWDLMGRAVVPPTAVNSKVYVLPLLSIKMNKATGVVTSVPSDAPDDYAALQDLKKDAAMRKKYFLTDEMVLPFDVVPIISIPGYTSDEEPCAAVKACREEKVKNQNSTKQLAAAKDKTYMMGFYKGVMTAGPHKGMTVQDAKPLIKDAMLEAGQAVVYSEPESEVISRSGDVCVVAHLDQWYLNYGEEQWKAPVAKHIRNTLETFNPNARKQFSDIVDWLHEWACSRSFGLGTQMPFDEQFVIESLSDSTIYMAFYTVAHVLQQGVLNGSVSTLADKPGFIHPDALSHGFWDALFLDTPLPAECKVPVEQFQKMKTEFDYWYPLDLRVSGKDLINNHLTMSLYNHQAIWQKEEMLPRSFFTNGHLMINSAKMSKSTGNFLTLLQAIDTFSADATRLALADAGDGLEDANLVQDVCNTAILRLTKEDDWIQNFTNTKDSDEYRDGDLTTFADQAFENELNKAVHDSDHYYSRMRFRDALRACFYQLTAARDNYRQLLGSEKMHRGLLQRYIDTLLVIFSPICPHFCETIWQRLGKSGLLVQAPWPVCEPEDRLLSRKVKFLFDTTHQLRTGLAKQLKKKGKKSLPPLDSVCIYVADEYPQHQQEVLKLMHQVYDEANPTCFDALPKLFKEHDTLRKQIKNAMQFYKFVEKQVQLCGRSSMDLTTPFDEKAFLEQNVHFLCRSTGGVDIKEVQIFPSSDESAADPGKKKAQAVPGSVSIFFFATDSPQ